MKSFVQTGFLPFLALAVAISAPSIAVAADVAKKPAPAVDEAALFTHDDKPIVQVKTPDPLKADPKKNQLLDCTTLPKRKNMTAWERGYEQATSGMRAGHRVTISKRTMPPRELSPCAEYKTLDKVEIACCAAAFRVGLRDFAGRMDSCGIFGPSGPGEEKCYDEFNTGVSAASRLCGQCMNAEKAEQALSDLDLSPTYPGCMAMGFRHRSRQCMADAVSARRPANSAYQGAMWDHRRRSNKADMLQIFRSQQDSSSSGGAHLGHNHPPGAHNSSCQGGESGFLEAVQD